MKQTQNGRLMAGLFCNCLQMKTLGSLPVSKAELYEKMLFGWKLDISTLQQLHYSRATCKDVGTWYVATYCAVCIFSQEVVLIFNSIC